MMKEFGQVFFKGLLVVLPLAITLALLYWSLSTIEWLLGMPLRWLLPEHLHWPGMGLIAGVLLIFLIGLLVDAYLIRHIFSFFERLLERIPLVKTIYTSARDLLKFLGGGKGNELKQVVAVELQGVRLIGFVTQESATLGERENLVAVYLPMSYQVGGYLVYLPSSQCEVLNMTVQEAMQKVLTADIAVEQNSDAH